MLFARKKPVGWREKLRIAIWPRRSWSRSTKYLAKRVLRITASPHAIAAGIAAGVFASFTPYLGFHFLLAFAVAYLIAGNIIAAATGTFFGNPITFPFIWAATLSTGNFILTGKFQTGTNFHQLKELARTDFWHMGWDDVWQFVINVWEPILMPMTVGAIPIGIVVSLIFYGVTRWFALAFQVSRRQKLDARALQEKESAAARSALSEMN